MYNIKKLNNISSTIYTQLPKERYLVSSHIDDSEADAFLVRSFDCLGMELSDRILAFARAGIGTNNIPVDRCTEKGIVVFNTPGANANAVKELVICAMLMASRNVINGSEWVNSVYDGESDIAKQIEKGKKQFVGPEISGKTLGVIGLGSIGVLVANAAVSLGMNVIGYDPYISVESAWHLSRAVRHGISLDDLLSSSDYITVHIPLMDKTKNYISGQEFAKMKDGAILLNFARAGIVSEPSLYDAIDNGKVAKYVTDFPDEYLMSRRRPEVILTPHIGASTPESEENCALMASRQLRDYLEKGSIVNSVNMPECVLGTPMGSRTTFFHGNLPNMVGQISAIIGTSGINISSMTNVSRREIAYTAIECDSPITEGIMEKLNSISGMIKIRRIS